MKRIKVDVSRLKKHQTITIEFLEYVLNGNESFTAIDDCLQDKRGFTYNTFTEIGKSELSKNGIDRAMLAKYDTSFAFFVGEAEILLYTPYNDEALLIPSEWVSRKSIGRWRSLFYRVSFNLGHDIKQRPFPCRCGDYKTHSVYWRKFRCEDGVLYVVEDWTRFVHRYLDGEYISQEVKKYSAMSLTEK